jgi:hypothetical protein
MNKPKFLANSNTGELLRSSRGLNPPTQQDLEEMGRYAIGRELKERNSDLSNAQKRNAADRDTYRLIR